MVHVHATWGAAADSITGRSHARYKRTWGRLILKDGTRRPSEGVTMTPVNDSGLAVRWDDGHAVRVQPVLLESCQSRRAGLGRAIAAVRRAERANQDEPAPLGAPDE